MLKALKFVQGAVAKKDFVPALTHFQIKDGRVQGFNGNLSLSSPIDCDLEATPRATPFIKAIETCRDTVAMSITPAGRLSIKSGKFKAFVECTEEPFPEVVPEGEYITIEPGLLKAIKGMAPFIAQDASRPWATGILLRGGSAFATNNILVAEQWLGYQFPVEVNIPATAIKELLRVKEDPIGIQINDYSITFHFEGERWLRSNVSSLDWPDLSPLLDRETLQQPFPEGFFDALEDISSFADDLDRVFFVDGVVTTNPVDGEGASVAVEGLPQTGCFQIKQLLHLRDKATSIDLTQYPAPCNFYGDNFRGAIVGMRT